MADTPIASKTTDFYLARHSILLVVVAGLSSAAFFYFGTGLHPIWWMLWLAPVPVLAVAPRFRAGAAFLLGLIAWLIGETNQWKYVRHYIELPAQIVALYFVIPAAVFGLSIYSCAVFFDADLSSRPRSLFLFTGWHTNIFPRRCRRTAHGVILLTHR